MQRTFPDPMTPTYPTITLAEFQSAIASRDVQTHLSPPLFARRKVLATAEDNCPLCRQPLDRAAPRAFSAPVIATCVHTFLGGPLIAENLFVSCRRCQQSRSSADLLTFPNLPDPLREQRAQALLVSQNHLAPLPPSASLTDYRQALVQRHAMPRSRIYAVQADDGMCMLGVSSRYGDRQSKGLAHLLGKWAGTPLLRDKRLSIYRLTDDDFRRVAWQLIDANAWLVGVGRRSMPRDFLDYWWVSSASVGELRLRKVAGVRVPQSVPDKREVGASAVRMRRMKERRKTAQERAEAEREFQECESAFDAMIRSRHQPTAFPTDPDEELAILTRYGKASRRLNAALGY